MTPRRRGRREFSIIEILALRATTIGIDLVVGLLSLTSPPMAALLECAVSPAVLDQRRKVFPGALRHLCTERPIDAQTYLESAAWHST